MIFLVRAAFWTLVVAMYVPGSVQGWDKAAGLQTLEWFKADVVHRLARVRAELHARDVRAP
jgi:hypothetical protein